ncbi:MAG: hypothetical protein R2729_05310 [Bryobacteraceae bacterium]
MNKLLIGTIVLALGTAASVSAQGPDSGTAARHPEVNQSVKKHRRTRKDGKHKTEAQSGGGAAQK